jgi:hypothetical protein
MKLETHLSLLQDQGVISGWHDRRIAAGTEWDGAINKNLEEAGVILLLVSADFLASRYCRDVEVKRAMERHEAGTARVIPVILRSVDWHTAPFGKLEALPRDGKAVTSWKNRDEAFTDVARGIREAVKDLEGAFGTTRQERPQFAASSKDEGPHGRPEKRSASRWHEGFIDALFGEGLELSRDQLNRSGRNVMHIVRQELEKRGHSDSDVTATSIVIYELIQNILVYSDFNNSNIKINSFQNGKEPTIFEDTVSVVVGDDGKSFDLKYHIYNELNILRQKEHEHGLLKCLRLGSGLEAVPRGEWHFIQWWRMARPRELQSRLESHADTANVILDFHKHSICIDNEIYRYDEICHVPMKGCIDYRSFIGEISWYHQHFFELVLEPIRRMAAKSVLIEIRGRYGTVPLGSVPPSIGFAARVLRFLGNNCPDSRVLIFVGTERHDHKLFYKLALKDLTILDDFGDDNEETQPIRDAIAALEGKQIEVFESVLKCNESLRINSHP